MIRTLALVLLPVCVLLPAADAFACGNAVLFSVDEETRHLARAEQLLANGQDATAFGMAMRALNVMTTGNPDSLMDEGGGRIQVSESRRARIEAQHQALLPRARRIAALATVRRNGMVHRERATSMRRLAEPVRIENLTWARDALAELAADEAPISRAAHAEALARFPESRAQARAILDSLRIADLMPDHHGFRVLAELAALAGDGAASEQAMSLCRERAGTRHRRLCPDVTPRS
jgi:hypothetical protein